MYSVFLLVLECIWVLIIGGIFVCVFYCLVLVNRRDGDKFYLKYEICKYFLKGSKDLLFVYFFIWIFLGGLILSSIIRYRGVFLKIFIILLR